MIRSYHNEYIIDRLHRSCLGDSLRNVEREERRALRRGAESSWLCPFQRMDHRCL